MKNEKPVYLDTEIGEEWIKRPRGLGLAYVVAGVLGFLGLVVIAYFVGAILGGRL